MPSHEFECRICHHRAVMWTPITESPVHPHCVKCRTAMGKNFRFGFGKVEIDVMSPSTGYHSSTRAYTDSLKRLTETQVERTGFDTEIVRAEPGDPQSAPPST